MWYKVDYNKLAILLLPTFLRKPKLVAFIQALIAPIDSIYYQWSNWRVKNIYKLEHTGQICYLRGSLNDDFDPVERRIRVIDSQLYDTTYIFTEAEEQDVWLATEDEPDTLWLRTEVETADTGLDFLVYVPEALYDKEIYALTAHIDFYKAGGKRYKILK